MPDYFVPVDTSSYTDYYRDLIGRGIFNRFILQYVDDHREEILSEYRDFADYKERYSPGESMLEELVAYATREDLAFEEEQWKVSRERIALLMKSYMARDLWTMSHFYEVYNVSSEVFRKAVEILQDPELLSQKLVKSGIE